MTIANVVRFKTKRETERQAHHESWAAAFASRLIDEMKNAGHSDPRQYANLIAQWAGIDRRTARNWLAGIPSRKTTFDRLQAIAEKLSVTSWWLCAGGGPRTLEDGRPAWALQVVGRRHPLLLRSWLKRVDRGGMTPLELASNALRWCDERKIDALVETWGTAAEVKA